MDVAGLPPTFLAVGELDLFVYDNLAYVQRLLTAGCSWRRTYIRGCTRIRSDG